MKKFLTLLMLLTMTSMLIIGCGKKEEPVVEEEPEPVVEVVEEEEEEEEKEDEDIGPEGTYRSELTNEWIDENLKDQRPVAVMVDNEIIALPHYGTADADVVYDIMNSQVNGRITRLMCLVKDWKKIEQMGSIRSIRPTNFMLAAEWNAVVVHDGGPSYIKEYLAKDYTNSLSGGFLRVDNGKSREFTEYIANEDKNGYSGLTERFKQAGFSETYNDNYPGPHFQFDRNEIDLSEAGDVIGATDIKLPFPHNETELKYNEENGTYDYYEYGDIHKDAETEAVLTFKNVLIQDCDWTLLDDRGYMVYNCVDSGKPGYYIVNGKGIPITWTKESETAPTRYYDLNGNEIKLNTGKTYITLIPSDLWESLSVQ